MQRCANRSVRLQICANRTKRFLKNTSVCLQAKAKAHSGIGVEVSGEESDGVGGGLCGEVGPTLQMRHTSTIIEENQVVCADGARVLC